MKSLMWQRFSRRRSAVVGLVLFLLLVAFAIFGGLFTRYSYTDTDFLAIGFPPGSGHWFGTNDAGNDLYAQVVHGLQRSLIIALAVAVGTTMIAAIAGSLAAFFGGWVEKATMGLIYLLLVVPSFLILAMTANATGGDWRWIIVALIVFGWMMLARVVYSMALSIREREFVIAARYMGERPWTIIARHIIPNMSSLLVINFALAVVGTVLTETGLSFLGLGVKIPDVSLGSLLQSGVGTIVASPWLFYFPAAVLTLLTLSMTLMADGLRDALDPNAANPTVTEPVEVAGAEPGGGR
ncbi:MAG TPA: ABC transporter permease [Gordonia sp. (in: high G+C Gram-positive bacteria)]|uniref:ABC transporter permease n=1 Tax=unclassified Gordonia (in: high G+C Gram-positive bacteria) TaxID=2657482 RepID=UPI000FBA2AC9|nr:MULTISPECIES: ABC transporter permease [unclassified Gordonia (in: high G+C Gram-positive bacteria)]RUP39175.1 MAG: ABC transporter permease [Gordonia sp. (in: high G+C Gram-positive bacteria)]HNP56499.1 ABC transporter permease [Gordonia sp. (in: high G+C Gram-positive bacteria)]HRC50648.1 ABC transporter permease [Gordonia sp. (in: high G+C Gram-positive bacteria)]